MRFFCLFVLTQQSEIVNQGHRKSGVSRWTTKKERGPKSHKWQKRHQKVRIRTIRTHRCHKNSTASVGAVYVSDPDLLLTQRRGKSNFLIGVNKASHYRELHLDSHVQIAELFVPGLELPLRSHSWYLTTTRGILVRDSAVYYRKSDTSMEKLTAFTYKIV